MDRGGRGQRGPGDRRPAAEPPFGEGPGASPLDTGFTGITDARFYLNERSIPTIILGPGSLGVAHMADESVEIAQLVARGPHLRAGVHAVPRRFVMERFDVFVIGGGGTGSEVAFQLAQRSGLRVAIAERDKLGGECSHYGCVPTKVMLRSAKIARAREGRRRGSACGSPRSRWTCRRSSAAPTR